MALGVTGSVSSVPLASLSLRPSGRALEPADWTGGHGEIGCNGEGGSGGSLVMGEGVRVKSRVTTESGAILSTEDCAPSRACLRVRGGMQGHISSKPQRVLMEAQVTCYSLASGDSGEPCFRHGHDAGNDVLWESMPAGRRFRGLRGETSSSKAPVRVVVSRLRTQTAIRGPPYPPPSPRSLNFP